MTALEIILITVCVLFVLFVIIKYVIDKRNGKCEGDCVGCSAYCQKKIYGGINMDKYLKCKSCGAIVRVIKPCNCKNCGITCCGNQMEEIENPNIKGTGKILTCASCGAKVEVIVPCNCANCGFTCCGEQMK